MARSVRKTLEHVRLLFNDPIAIGILVILIVGSLFLLVPLPA